MPLQLGARLGPYEILEAIGAGGMGEVYRARDTRLGREVAVKVLPAGFAADADRLSRFEHEARAAAALNHPNILAVYDIGTHTSTDSGQASPYIVSELLEGKTLRELMTAKPMTPRRVIDYALQMLSGLAAAHEKGIVHRDLKPENIFITKDGRVKILDFGLAKLDKGGDDATRSRVTGAGIVMGTVGYMSPEQVRGHIATHRSDLFSFGVIMYELLSGRSAFARETGAETMTAVLNDDPRELSDGHATVHPAIESIVRRCLEKAPDRRFHSADDLGFALRTVQTLSDSHSAGAPAPARATTSAGKAASRAYVRSRAVVGSALLIVAALALARGWFGREQIAEAPALRLAFPPPHGTSIGNVAVSPDGRGLAFNGTTGAKAQLWVRGMDETTARPIAGTEGANQPFWSPDSRSIGYFAAGKLKKVDLQGGVSTTLADVGVATGGTWNRDGVIVFGSLGGSGLSKVTAAGGEVASVRAPDTGNQETDFSNPWFLPDGRHFLYNIFTGQKDRRGIYLSSLDGTVNRRIVPYSSNGVYASVPGAGGFLLFSREEALMAQPFDAGSLQLTGEAIAVADYVASSFDGTGAGIVRRNFSASETGLIVLDSVRTRLRSQLVWVDRDGGHRTPIDGMTSVSMVKLSPDGRRFVVARFDDSSGNNDLWLSPAEGGQPTRVTFDPANDPFPVWSPDGQQIAWGSNRHGIYDIYQRAASGSGQDALLWKSALFKLPTDWSHDGQYILYRQIDPATHYDIWALPLRGADSKPFAVLHSEANEAAAVLSPDGKWLAFGSDESGRYEVYLQSFPNGGGKRQVSTAGGNAPQWRRDGRELYFQALDGKLMATSVEGGANITTTAPVALFEFFPGGNLVTPYYTVTPDGRRFLLSTLVETDAAAPLAVIVNWHSLLRRRD